MIKIVWIVINTVIHTCSDTLYSIIIAARELTNDWLD